MPEPAKPITSEANTKEPVRPDYEDVKGWSCSQPSGLEGLLARALWLEEQLDTPGKPVGERPDVEAFQTTYCYQIGGQALIAAAYILALEAENARLRARLTAANDPTHGHPDETDDRRLEARLDSKL